MNNTKHYTHPTLGINVYKGNVAYFDELEKNAKERELLKDKKIKGKEIFNQLYSGWLTWNFATLFFNPILWVGIYITIDMFDSSKGIEQLSKEAVYFTYYMVVNTAVGLFLKYKSMK